jgi:hypothetical protein
MIKAKVLSGSGNFAPVSQPTRMRPRSAGGMNTDPMAMEKITARVRKRRVQR